MTFIVFHFLLAMFILSFYLASTRSPGRIPLVTQQDMSYWRDGSFKVSEEVEAIVKNAVANLDVSLDAALKAMVKNMIVVERKKKYGSHRYCSFCTLFKPDRAHHCRMCGQCTLRMDHHCPWLANCIGYSNYKYFLLTVFYAFCLNMFFTFTMTPTMATFIQPEVLGYHVIPASFVYICCLILSGCLLVFFGFHMSLTMNALTTIEWREKKNSKDKYVQRRFQVAHLKFDNGVYNNMVEALGPVYLWLVPYFGGQAGTFFPRQRATSKREAAILEEAYMA